MKQIILPIISSVISFSAHADAVVGQTAPLFTAKNQLGKDFNLESRKGKWTVLYFYPKAETPGCTKQACAFSDNIKHITALGADVYGISVNSVADQKKFTDKHGLKFDLLADDKGEITKLYGAKMPVLNMSKRWTFIVDPDLKIQSLDKDVDPALDFEHVTKKLKELQASSKAKT